MESTFTRWINSEKQPYIMQKNTGIKKSPIPFMLPGANLEIVRKISAIPGISKNRCLKVRPTSGNLPPLAGSLKPRIASLFSITKNTARHRTSRFWPTASYRLQSLWIKIFLPCTRPITVRPMPRSLSMPSRIL